VGVVAEPAALVAEEGFVLRSLEKKMFQGICCIVALETEVLTCLDEKSLIGLAVGIVAGCATANCYRPVHVAGICLLGMAFAAENGVVLVYAIRPGGVDVAESAIVLGNDAVGAVEPVVYLFWNGGVEKEIDGERHDADSAELESVHSFLKGKNGGENPLLGVEHNAVVINIEGDLLHGRIGNLAYERGGKIVENGVVRRRQEDELACRLAIIVGTVTGETELPLQHPAPEEIRLVATSGI
jgi:hypothetical protein